MQKDTARASLMRCSTCCLVIIFIVFLLFLFLILLAHPVYFYAQSLFDGCLGCLLQM